MRTALRSLALVGVLTAPPLPALAGPRPQDPAVPPPPPEYPLPPASTLAEAITAARPLILVEDVPDLVEHAELLREHLGPGAEVRAGDDIDPDAVADRDLLVLGSPEGHPWLGRHADRLPFRFVEDGVVIDGWEIGAAHPVVACTLRNPVDPEREVVVLCAPDVDDLVGLAPPTGVGAHWRVTDRERTLALGMFLRREPVAPETLGEDLDFLVASLLATHRATADGPPPAFEAAVEAARGAIEELPGPLPLPRAWALLAPVPASLGDVYADLRLPWRGPDLPVDWVWCGDVLRVRDPGGAPGVNAGDAVRSLGGRAPLELLEETRALLGHANEFGLRSEAARLWRNPGFWESRGLDPRRGVPCRFGDDGSADPHALRPAFDLDRPLPEAYPVFDEEADLALLDLPEYPERRAGWQLYVAFFEEVRRLGIGRVAIDVRENRSGDCLPVLHLLMQLRTPAWDGFGGTMRVTDESNAQGRTWHEPGIVPVDQPHMEAQEEGFDGELFVLTSPRTRGGGAWLPVLVQDLGLGQVVGESPALPPTHFGEVLDFRLPGLDLGFGASCYRWVRPAPGRDPADRLVPDLPVTATEEDLREGVDPALRLLLER